jgi:tol-pal system protein YbgF
VISRFISRHERFSKLSMGRSAIFLFFLAPVLVTGSLSGCLTRVPNPPLPYVKPANTVPDVDQGRVRIFARMEEMEAELRRLRGMIERMQAQPGEEKAIVDLQKRVAFIERQLGIAQRSPLVAPDEKRSPGSPDAEGRAPNSQPAPDSGLIRLQSPQKVEIQNAPIPPDERTFREAYLLVRENKPKDAVPLFEAFLKKYPKSRLVPEALYWHGEALFALGRYDEAVLQFDRVIKEHPGSKKELSALLKQGEAFAKMGDKQSARIIFEKLIKEDPHSAQARVANVKLKQLSAQ